MNLQKVGKSIVMRNIARTDGTVTTAITGTIVSATPQLLAIFVPKGTPFKNNWNVPPEKREAYYDQIVPSGQRRHEYLTWRSDTLKIYLPSRPYSVWAFFGESGQFEGWYGNLEAPFVNTPIGIDYRDYALDIVIDAGQTHDLI